MSQMMLGNAECMNYINQKTSKRSKRCGFNFFFFLSKDQLCLRSPLSKTT